jgi:hypothetical protein
MSSTQVLQVQQALAQGIEGAKREWYRGFVGREFPERGMGKPQGWV